MIVTTPQFESLNPALNDAFEAYLRKRGVDGALAGFVPRYTLWKEQRECYFFCWSWRAKGEGVLESEREGEG
jgi:hypothetical protein